MTEGPRHQTAKIYTFPIKNRQLPQTPANIASWAYEPAKNIVTGNCWYHDEAIAEAAPGRKS